ncbi:hypothetical protein [Bradyrhizobium murdochi]|uniref:hypothetical protein n=1 Tax=Bradyrhizobium murdochi TaxID=1038859 RepID=UPI00040718E3|nr:hypothetical protein [Bradyrhizobium murdochi]
MQFLEFVTRSEEQVILADQLGVFPSKSWMRKRDVGFPILTIPSRCSSTMTPDADRDVENDRRIKEWLLS